jgi:uncharacterized membrane protein
MLPLRSTRIDFVTLHAVGTAALGGAIFLAGQIFNMQEHWPTGILLWASGALAGWWLLRSWPQLAFAALLVPFWLMGEWTEAASHSLDNSSVIAAFAVLLAMCYLSLPDRTFRGTFRWIGGILLLPSAVVLVVSQSDGYARASTHGTVDVIGWIGAFALPLGVAAVYRRSSAWMNAVAAVWVGVLSARLLYHTPTAIFAWCAVGSAGMIAWGVYEFRAERINLGMAGFAITILVFYFSSVMDKLGRSASLIVLGVLFLAGAWYWEKLRRKLVVRIQAGGVA